MSQFVHSRKRVWGEGMEASAQGGSAPHLPIASAMGCPLPLAGEDVGVTLRFPTLFTPLNTAFKLTTTMFLSIPAPNAVEPSGSLSSM